MHCTWSTAAVVCSTQRKHFYAHCSLTCIHFVVFTPDEGSTSHGMTRGRNDSRLLKMNIIVRKYSKNVPTKTDNVTLLTWRVETPQARLLNSIPKGQLYPRLRAGVRRMHTESKCWLLGGDALTHKVPLQLALCESESNQWKKPRVVLELFVHKQLSVITVFLNPDWGCN